MITEQILLMKKFLDERRRADYEKILYEQFVVNIYL